MGKTKPFFPRPTSQATENAEPGSGMLSEWCVFFFFFYQGKHRGHNTLNGIAPTKRHVQNTSEEKPKARLCVFGSMQESCRVK
jgi:hypothetical protein